ncbi:MAG TPA: kynureninase [Candidatus Limnocylindrales bacterium]|nr:kynureninase [Candidatus Limnocylindrales bacterium]
MTSIAPSLETEYEDARRRDGADRRSAAIRERFNLPVGRDRRPKAYLAGQSLGAQPKAARAAVEERLDAWARLGVDGWFDPERPWIDVERELADATGGLVGAAPAEVTTANTLSIDLHLLLASFFRPDGVRRRILIDAPTFPSDRYVVESQLGHHGLDPATDLIVVRPRSDEDNVRPDDLDEAIDRHREELAVTLLSGVNYATGQAFDIARHTARAHAAGAVAIWDLAHAAGNIPLALHDANVDAAAWCTYKYLNSGPGALAQLFVHERHATDPATPRLAGWWGNDPDSRFLMAERFVPGRGADGFRVSTPPILSLAPVAVSLSMFDEVGMTALRERSVALTSDLERLIDAYVPDATIITPRDPSARGSQLSIRVADAHARLLALETFDVVVDVREPDLIRLAPVPMYCSFEDVVRAADALRRTA